MSSPTLSSKEGTHATDSKETTVMMTKSSASAFGKPTDGDVQRHDGDLRSDSISSAVGESSSGRDVPPPLYRPVKNLHDEYTFRDSDRIGCGAFSVVYRATRREQQESPQKTSAQEFALKIIPRAKFSDTEKHTQREEVDREVSVLISLHHSGCTHFIEALQTSDAYCIVMEKLSGCMDAAKYVERHGSLDPTHASLIVYQLLRTASYLHDEFCLLHRDIKMENIILSSVAAEVEGDAAHVATDALQDPSSSDTAEMSEGRGAPPQCSEPLVMGAVEVPLDLPAERKRRDDRRPVRSSVESPLPGGPKHATAGKPSELFGITNDDKLLRFGKATLVDFGLARWIPKLTNSTSVSPLSDTLTSTSAFALMPPLSQLQLRKANSSEGISDQQEAPQHELCGENDANSSSRDNGHGGENMLMLGLCGSEKYLPHEMLKWIVEHGATGRRKPSSRAHAAKIDVYAIGVVAYILLSGCYPHSGKNKALLAQQQATSALKMNSTHWAKVPLEAKSFVAKLLATDPHQRFSVEEALRHPWMAHAGALAGKLHIDPRVVMGAPTLSPTNHSKGLRHVTAPPEPLPRCGGSAQLSPRGTCKSN